MLQEDLRKQVKIAAWQFGLGFGIIIGYIFFAFGLFFLGFAGWIIGGIIIAGAGIAQLVLWIMGIVNAVKIHNQTNDSAVLIIFSIITFWFGHLIVAISQRNKYAGVSTINTHQEQRANIVQNNEADFESKLKESFMHGIISADEYEKKLKEHKTKK